MRLGVNIPNDLVERFRPLKSTLNLSQICRDAIKSRVEAYERAVNQAKADGMHTIADKLAADYLKRTVLDWEAIGRDDGKVWAQLTSLENLEGFFYNLEIHRKRGQTEPGPYLFPQNIPEAPRFENHIQEHDEWFLRQIELDESVNIHNSPAPSELKNHINSFNEWLATQEFDVSNNPYIKAKKDYIRGWVSYLTAVWEMVKDRVAADAVSREEARQQAKDKPKMPNL